RGRLPSAAKADIRSRYTARLKPCPYETGRLHRGSRRARGAWCSSRPFGTRVRLSFSSSTSCWAIGSRRFATGWGWRLVPVVASRLELGFVGLPVVASRLGFGGRRAARLKRCPYESCPSSVCEWGGGCRHE